MRRSTWWLLCFGWTDAELCRNAFTQYSRTEMAVLITGWLMTLYTVVTLPLAWWVIT